MYNITFLKVQSEYRVDQEEDVIKKVIYMHINNTWLFIFIVFFSQKFESLLSQWNGRWRANAFTRIERNLQMLTSVILRVSHSHSDCFPRSCCLPFKLKLIYSSAFLSFTVSYNLLPVAYPVVSKITYIIYSSFIFKNTFFHDQDSHHIYFSFLFPAKRNEKRA